MKYKIVLLIVLIGLVVVPLVLAKGQEEVSGQGRGQGVSNLQDGGDQDLGQGNEVKNQNQVKTQNQGEDSQIQVNTKENESAGEVVGNRSEKARDHMSEVAKKVEELLLSSEVVGGIGSEVRQVAREQNEAQVEIEGEYEKLDLRQGWVKKIFGPDYKAIKNLRKQMEQNQVRVRQLERIQVQVMNEGEKQQLAEMISAIVNENMALEEKIQAEEDIGSIFGWLSKLFN